MGTDVVIRMAGTAGEGALVLGDILGQTLAKLGWHVRVHFTFEAEVRGEKPSYSELRVSDSPRTSQGGPVDLLLGLNSAALELNLPELSPGGAALYDGTPIDPFRGEQEYKAPLPEGARGVCVPLESITATKIGVIAAKNMVALGALIKLLGIPFELVDGMMKKRFAKKGERAVEANAQALALGYGHDTGAGRLFDFKERGAPMLYLSGNRAAALGAMAGGCSFFAGYPITPASEVMEYMARDLPALGGTVIQAEDEIAALGMVLGASYAGSRAMTATSGPGLSLMSEMLGLSEAAEVPAVVLDVQRGGPSTGLPTRTEQSDLELALYGGHGDNARIVMAPTSVEECFYALGRAQGLAAKYQMPVIVLTDQYLGYLRESVETLEPEKAQGGERVRPSAEQLEAYKRYSITEDGVSPMSVPGEPGGMFVATGLEHTEDGTPAYDAETHGRMYAKRFAKLKTARAEKWFKRFGIDGPVDVGVMAWGGTVGAAMEALKMANDKGIKAAGFYSVFISPLPEDEMREFIGSVKTLIVPELNFTGQFARLLREKFGADTDSFAWPDGMPASAGRILERIMEYGG